MRVKEKFQIFLAASGAAHPPLIDGSVDGWMEPTLCLCLQTQGPWGVLGASSVTNSFITSRGRFNSRIAEKAGSDEHHAWQKVVRLFF